MNENSRAVAENFDYADKGYSAPESRLTGVTAAPEIPEYLQNTYWWAYLHPNSFYFFEREWVGFFPSPTGRPATLPHLVAGLLYLQHAFALSDEAVMARWAENPYWEKSTSA